MEEKELKIKILNACVECVEAWKTENGGDPVNINYDDYVNYCHNYGGSELSGMIGALMGSDEEQQDFYESVCYACEKANRGIRSAMGNHIQFFRLRCGLSQQELADKAGITKTNLSRIECGLYSVPLDVLDKIATALGLSIELG